MKDFNQDYWSSRWKNGETQWDVGYPSTPLKEYIDQLENKDLNILIPGAGNGWEGIYLLESGFHRTIILDITSEPLENLKAKLPEKFHANLVLGDFFEHTEKYDLILEQTFFCSFDPSLRPAYVKKAAELLNKGGKLCGVVFNDTLNSEFPPFGGNENEYRELFAPYFDIKMEKAYNSIKPRQDREIFIRFVKK